MFGGSRRRGGWSPVVETITHLWQQREGEKAVSGGSKQGHATHKSHGLPQK